MEVGSGVSSGGVGDVGGGEHLGQVGGKEGDEIIDRSQVVPSMEGAEPTIHGSPAAPTPSGPGIGPLYRLHVHQGDPDCEVGVVDQGRDADQFVQNGEDRSLLG